MIIDIPGGNAMISHQGIIIKDFGLPVAVEDGTWAPVMMHEGAGGGGGGQYRHRLQGTFVLLLREMKEHMHQPGLTSANRTLVSTLPLSLFFMLSMSKAS